MLTTEHLTTKRKRSGEDTECLIENQNTCEKGDLTPGSMCSDIVSEAGIGNMSKPSDSSSSELSKYFTLILRQCVVSLASFIEGTMLFGCTGMFIPPASDDDPTSILTSASLIRSSIDESKIIDNLTVGVANFSALLFLAYFYCSKSNHLVRLFLLNRLLQIKVRLPNDLVVIGWLGHYDLKYDLAIVNIERLRPFRAPTLGSRFQLQFESNSKVVAVGRCFNSGMLTTTSVMEIGRLNDEVFELDMALLGGPIVSIKCGNIAGMTCRGGKRAVFQPRDKIIECLEHFGIRTDITKGGHGTKEPVKIATNRDYPVRKHGWFLELSVHKSFEEKFEGDIWSELSKELSSAFSECVVALASFNEGRMHFACTGVFIDRYPARILTSASLVRSYHNKSKIDDNLQIEVCLQNKSRVRATLKHYDLRYNVAIVDIICFRSPYAIELKKDIRIRFTPNMDVVAVG